MRKRTSETALRTSFLSVCIHSRIVGANVGAGTTRVLVRDSGRWPMVAGPHSRPLAIAEFDRNCWPAVKMDVMKAKVFHIITKLELGGAQKVTLMTLERLPRERYDVALITHPDGLLVDWANRIPGLTRYWIPSLIREVQPVQDFIALVSLWRLFRRERP